MKFTIDKEGNSVVKAENMRDSILLTELRSERILILPYAPNLYFRFLLDKIDFFHLFFDDYIPKAKMVSIFFRNDPKSGYLMIFYFSPIFENPFS